MNPIVLGNTAMSSAKRKNTIMFFLNYHTTPDGRVSEKILKPVSGIFPTEIIR